MEHLDTPQSGMGAVWTMLGLTCMVLVHMELGQVLQIPLELHCQEFHCSSKVYCYTSLVMIEP